MADLALAAWPAGNLWLAPLSETAVAYFLRPAGRDH